MGAATPQVDASSRADLVAGLRARGTARFEELGYPTTRLEDWKYTNVQPIARAGFTASREVPDEAVAELVASHALAGGGPRLVFVNGRLSRGLSDLARLPSTVRATSLVVAASEHRDLVEPHLGRVGALDGRAFGALNAGSFQDGAFVNVPDGVALTEPIELLFVSYPDGRDAASHPRSLVVLGRSAQASIVETFVGAPGATYLSNAVTEAVVGENSTLDHVRVIDEDDRAFHVSSLDVRVERAGTLRCHAASLGGALVRCDIDVALAGEGADCRMDGLYVVGETRHVDFHTFVDHAVPHGTSQQTFKGIAYDKGRGVFGGRILVRQDAQKTDARQSNQNLLLSDDAWIDTKPQLEIFADDVKCAHGATVGQLDADAVYYLRCRGIGEEQAKAMLTTAFAGEVISRVEPESLRSRLGQRLGMRLPGADGGEEKG